MSRRKLEVDLLPEGVSTIDPVEGRKASRRTVALDPGTRFLKIYHVDVTGMDPLAAYHIVNTVRDRYKKERAPGDLESLFVPCQDGRPSVQIEVYEIPED